MKKIIMLLIFSIFLFSCSKNEYNSKLENNNEVLNKKIKLEEKNNKKIEYSDYGVDNKEYSMGSHVKIYTSTGYIFTNYNSLGLLVYNLKGKQNKIFSKEGVWLIYDNKIDKRIYFLDKNKDILQLLLILGGYKKIVLDSIEKYIDLINSLGEYVPNNFSKLIISYDYEYSDNIEKFLLSILHKNIEKLSFEIYCNSLNNKKSIKKISNKITEKILNRDDNFIIKLINCKVDNKNLNNFFEDKGFIEKIKQRDNIKIETINKI